MLWDMGVHTQNIGANRRDIIIKDKMDSTFKLTDMTVLCEVFQAKKWKGKASKRFKN